LRLDKLLAEQILELIDTQTHKLLGAIQDGRVVLGGSAGSAGGVGDPPAGFWGQLRQANVTYDTAGNIRACASGSAGSNSLVDNLDAIRLGWEMCNDAIGERHIDWGTGAGQVSAVDVPFQTTSGSIDATNVRDAIEETYAECYGNGGNGVGTHNLLSASHPDTDPASCLPGALIRGSSGSLWERLTAGSDGRILTMESGLPEWSLLVEHDHSDASEGGDDLNPETISQQTFLVGPGCPHTTVGSAVDAINAAGPPASGSEYVILGMGGTTIESGNVTIPGYTTLEGRGTEAFIVDIGNNRFATENGGSNVGIRNLTIKANTTDDYVAFHGYRTTDLVLFNVRVILEPGYTSNIAFNFAGDSTVRADHCRVESSAGSFVRGFSINDTAIVSMQDCEATDAGLDYGLYVADTACIATTLDCRFAGDTDDVYVGSAGSWSHFKCNYDINNSTIDGTEIPLQDGPVEIASDAIRGHDSLYPDLGTTTAAQMMGNAYLGDGHDIYPDGDTAGVAERLINFGDDPDDEFRGSFGFLTTGWAGAPFDGTPDTVDFSSYPDFVVIGDGTTNDRFFRYRTITHSLGSASQIKARLNCITDCRTGIRIDTGDDTDFAELYVETTTTGLCDIVGRWQENGGGITTTVLLNDVPIQTFRLRIQAQTNNNLAAYYAIDTQIEALFPGTLGDMDNWSTTPTRVGIIFQRTAGTNTGARRGFFDWFYCTFSLP